MSGNSAAVFDDREPPGELKELEQFAIARRPRLASFQRRALRFANSDPSAVHATSLAPVGWQSRHAHRSGRDTRAHAFERLSFAVSSMHHKRLMMQQNHRGRSTSLIAGGGPTSCERSFVLCAWQSLNCISAAPAALNRYFAALPFNSIFHRVLC